MKINKDFRNSKNANEVNSFSSIYKPALDSTALLKKNYTCTKNNLSMKKVTLKVAVNNE